MSLSESNVIQGGLVRFFLVFATVLLLAGCSDNIDGVYEKTSNRNPLMTQVKSIELTKDNGAVINGSGFTKKTTYTKKGDLLTISPNQEPLLAVYNKEKKSFELWKETFTLKSK